MQSIGRTTEIITYIILVYRDYDIFLKKCITNHNIALQLSDSVLSFFSAVLDSNRVSHSIVVLSNNNIRITEEAVWAV